MELRTILYKNNELKIIDQRLLPQKLAFKVCRNINQLHHCIKTLAVRGAPAIGVFAAYGLYVGIRNIRTSDKNLFFKRLSDIAEYLKHARPTAVNLSWALGRMKAAALKNQKKPIWQIKKILLNEAKKIQQEDELMCRAIGRNGANLIMQGDAILTHCNAGMLATAGEGTALAVIYRAKRDGKGIKVYADETRPLLQGARLTAWELKRNGIDVTLICDNMAATLMKQGKINKVIVGADRIARNGDFANKIGTYNLAILARAHNIPFYVAAPSSTFDFNIKDGNHIPIEERHHDEVKRIAGRYIAPRDVKVYNPAFDVTPNNLVTAIITEKGVFRRPYSLSLKRIKPHRHYN